MYLALLVLSAVIAIVIADDNDSNYDGWPGEHHAALSCDLIIIGGRALVRRFISTAGMMLCKLRVSCKIVRQVPYCHDRFVRT